MPELVKTKALVLQSIRWHETSKIVTLYSRELGLLKAIARGVFRKNSPLAGRLETLNLIQAVISSKETRELQIITSADILDLFSSLKSDLERLPYALAMLETVQKLLPTGHNDSLFFEFLVQMIRAVEQSRQPLIVFWYFLLKFSSYLGFKPDFNRCYLCHQTKFKNGAFFNAQKGGLVCTDCAHPSFQSLRLNVKEIHFLQQLQNFHYKKIHQLTCDFGFSIDFTSLFLQYLNVHTGHPLKLDSLKMIL